MATSLVLLPSPLLGPSVWQPAARALAALGWTSTTCAPRTAVRTAQDVLEAFVADLPADDDLVLVAHSNAGAYVPAITSRHRSILGAIFVDAVLPPTRGHVPLAPPAFLEFLRLRADAAGLLPVWTDWWEESEVAALFPDHETRQQIEQEQARLPAVLLPGPAAGPRRLGRPTNGLPRLRRHLQPRTSRSPAPTVAHHHAAGRAPAPAARP